MRKVVVFSSPDDAHFNELARVARARGLAAPHLVTLSSFPREVTGGLRLWPEPRLRIGEVAIERGDSVWWRRPQRFGVAESLGRPSARRFVERECAQLVDGGLLAVAPFFVNHPVHDAAAANKCLQLELARQVGLRVPRTLCSSSPEEIRGFAREVGRAIYKVFTGPEDRFCETRELTSDLLDQLPGVELAPMIVQELVPAERDLRVTVVGRRALAVAIRALGPAPFDWRLDRAARFEPAALEAAEQARIFSLLDRLQLEYGALDFRLTRDGPVFLECNPGGQYLFCEIEGGLPITSALVDLLYRPEEHARLRARA